MSVTASVLEMSVIWSLMSMTDVSGRLLFLDRQSFLDVWEENLNCILVDIEEKEVRKKIQ